MQHWEFGRKCRRIVSRRRRHCEVRAALSSFCLDPPPSSGGVPRSLSEDMRAAGRCRCLLAFLCLPLGFLAAFSGRAACGCQTERQSYPITRSPRARPFYVSHLNKTHRGGERGRGRQPAALPSVHVRNSAGLQQPEKRPRRRQQSLPWIPSKIKVAPAETVPRLTPTQPAAAAHASPLARATSRFQRLPFRLQRALGRGRWGGSGAARGGEGSGRARCMHTYTSHPPHTLAGSNPRFVYLPVSHRARRWGYQEEGRGWL